jgi:hypothetical protein
MKVGTFEEGASSLRRRTYAALRVLVRLRRLEALYQVPTNQYQSSSPSRIVRGLAMK